MKISRPVLINVSLAIVIAVAIAGSLIFLLPKSAASSEADATQLTTTVQLGAVSSTITASGSVAAKSEVSADFEVSGTVKAVDVSLGETVKKGQTLGTLVKGDFADALADAQEDLADAYESVSDANESISDAEDDADSSNEQTASSGEQALSSAEDQLDQANDQVDTALDAVATAQDNVDATTLKAPIAGLVIAVTGTVGGSSGSSSGSSSGASTGDTTTSTGFVTIADVSKMTLTASIAEADIADVAVGQTADVTFPALTDTTTTATVTAVAPTATASNSVVTYATTITLDEIPDGLRLGQTAEATITTVSSADDALYVPTAAITTATDGTSTVDVVGDDDEVTTTTVELGVVGDEGTEITSGLEEGQTVVLGTVAATTDDTSTDTGNTGGFGGQGGTGGFTGGGTGGFPGGGTGGGPGQ